MPQTTRTTTTTDQPEQTTPAEGAVQMLDPSTLLIDLNVRHDDRLDRAFVASIKDLGVLVPIVAVTTEEGVRVRYGHRRTRAAVEAKLPRVPVVIAADERADERGDGRGDGRGEVTDAATIERLVSQHAENQHRAGLTNAERIDLTEQLSLLGLSAARIAKRTQTKRADVDAALAVAGCELAKAATARHDWLTLDQAAAVAEFEDDTEAVKNLIAAAKTGRFDHVAQRMRDERAEATERAEQTAALQAQGLRVIDRPAYNDPTASLDRLREPDAENGTTLDADQHREHCPGHVTWLETTYAWIDAQTGQQVDDDPNDPNEDDEDDEDDEAAAEALGRAEHRKVFVSIAGCDEPTRYGHVDRYQYATGGGRTPAAQQSEAEREEARAARRLVIENNKAWDSAETVRREFVQQFVARKTAPTGAAAFIATTLVHDQHFVAQTAGNHLTSRWLGGEPSGYGADHHPADLIAGATDKRALMVALALVLGAHEAHLDRSTWRRDGTQTSGAAHGRYLRFLAANGYTLADVEEYAISDQTA